MLRYIPILAIIGVIAAILFAVIDKCTAGMNEKKRKFIKIVSYIVLFMAMGIVVDIIVSEYK